MRTRLLWLMVSVLLVLPGCARYVVRDTVPVSQGEPGVEGGEAQDAEDAQAEAEEERRRTPKVRTEAPPLLPAARDLLDRAEAARRAGDLRAALSFAERAQRIAPRAPEVYLVLARVHLDAGSPARAEQLARKAGQLAGSSRELAREARRLAEEARAAR